MTLERGQIIGYDVSRMAFEFTMIGKARIVVDCEISSTAMDQLAGTKGTMPDEKEAKFLHLRDTIEGIAADIFDEQCWPSDPGTRRDASSATTHDNPTYEVDGIIHYCVANMPGAVPLRRLIFHS
jgi:Alanine dehydrogenase/PNT, C-terminal domain